MSVNIPINQVDPTAPTPQNTPLQHAPAVLSQLLLLSSTYELDHLQSLVKHAMHRALSYATSVGIYGVSTLCSCRSLQIS